MLAENSAGSLRTVRVYAPVCDSAMELTLAMLLAAATRASWASHAAFCQNARVIADLHRESFFVTRHSKVVRTCAGSRPGESLADSVLAHAYEAAMMQIGLC